MKAEKTLVEVNPYLRDPIKRRRLLRISADTSAAIEGIKIKSAKSKKQKIRTSQTARC